MGKILFITNTSSAIFFGMKEQLEEAHHEVSVLSTDMNEIHSVSDKADAMLIYLDENILEDTKPLIHISDLAVEKEIGVFLIGYEGFFEAARKVMPNDIIQQEFHRPVDMKTIVQEVGEYIVEREKNRKKKILVVDDSGIMLRIIKKWLDDKYQVILTNSGSMALKHMAQDIPDLILLDYEMPICDGKQVFQMIRSETEYAQVPIFFLTGKNDRESVEKLLALKPEGYLLKTVQPEEIVKTIDNFFAKNIC